MEVEILDFKANVPRMKSATLPSFSLPPYPSRTELAELGMFLAPSAPGTNWVSLKAVVGISPALALPNLQFRVYRDGMEVGFTEQSIEPEQESGMLILQAMDYNVLAGYHRYTLCVERGDSTSAARIVGPVSFSGLAVGRNR